MAASPVIQQPISDTRHTIPTESEDKPSSDSNSDERHPQSTVTEEHAIPEKSLPSPAPEPVESVDASREQTQDVKQSIQPLADIVTSQPSQSTGQPSADLTPSTEPATITALDDDASHAPTSAIASTANGQNNIASSFDEDHVMNDVDQPTKIGRAREGDDDLDDEPAAKRTRTEDDGGNDAFKVPDRPQIDTSVATEPESEPAKTKPEPMTKPRKKHLQKSCCKHQTQSGCKTFFGACGRRSTQHTNLLHYSHKPHGPKNH